MKCISLLLVSVLPLAFATEQSTLIASSATRPEDPAKLHSERRRLSPKASIIDELNSQLADGIKHPRFTLTASGGSSNLFTAASPFEIDVVLTNPSVSESTSFSVDGFNSSVQNPMKLLVADRASRNQSSGEFAILSVNEKNSSVSGIVQKDKQLFRLEQHKDGLTVVTEVNYVPPNNWTCLVNSTHYHDETGGKEHTAEEKHVHKHRQHVFDTSSTIFNNRRATKRKLYATDTFPNAWSYQVDLYIQVDNEFVANHDNDTVNMPNTIDYVNALVSAASSIFEFEIDTHLNVLHIEATTMYDGASDAQAALDLMKANYSGNTWHYADPVTGENPDLHHFMSFRSEIVGVASVGGVCDSLIGYGVTGGMVGSLSSIDGSMFWDLDNLAHELGHNFGSFHTHDITNGYDPLIDACGNGDCTSLVTGSQISSGEASIMSYCQACPGGVSNIGLTFGGHWNEDDRSNVSNWVDTDSTVPFSQDPRRVPKVMYDNVSVKGTCVVPYKTPDIQTCTQDTDCHDGNSCTVDLCEGDQCTNTMENNCCGNFICEIGEASCSDCGPFTLNTPTCSSCSLPEGIMFDVEAINDVILTSIEFQLYEGVNSVNVYTAAGGYGGKETIPRFWDLLATDSYNFSVQWSFVSITFSEIQLSAGSLQGFYIASSSKIATLKDSTDVPWARDDNIILLDSNRAVVSTEFGSAYSEKLSWIGSMMYKLMEPISSESPSSSPSESPSVGSSSSPSTGSSESPSFHTSDMPSSNPSGEPSLVPSEPPTLTPSLNPSNSPSELPTQIKNPPTTEPSSSPSKSPIATPTVSPTVSPSASPSVSPSSSPLTAPTASPASSSVSPVSTTVSPSASPSVSPSSSPLTAPTASPASSSVSPVSTTVSPSASPSVSPSSSPLTAQVTSSPSNLPSVSPSDFPSISPSLLPSFQPTSIPSNVPSFSPSNSPMATPSAAPSASLQPSLSVSLMSIVNDSDFFQRINYSLSFPELSEFQFSTKLPHNYKHCNSRNYSRKHNLHRHC